MITRLLSIATLLAASNLAYAECIDDFSDGAFISLDSDVNSATLFSYPSRTDGADVASGRFTLTSPAFVNIRHVEGGPRDSVGELYAFASEFGLIVRNDDPLDDDDRRFFEIQDAFLSGNSEYCLDVRPWLDRSEMWNAVIVELSISSFDNIVTLNSTDIQLTEGEDFTLSVNLSRPLGSDLQFTLHDDFSGEADELDFEIVDLGNQQVIPAGETSRSIVITATDDTVEESVERRRFSMSFNDENNIFVTDIQVLMTLFDNDQPTAVNQPPVVSPFTIPQLELGESLSFTVQASDPDNDTISYNLNNEPGWMSVSQNGVLEGTPDAAGSSQGIQLTASDGRGGVANINFGVVVVEPTEDKPGPDDTTEVTPDPDDQTADQDGEENQTDTNNRRGGGSINLGLLLLLLTFIAFTRKWNGPVINKY